MRNRHAARTAVVVIAITVGLMVAGVAAPAGATAPPVGVSANLTYTGSTTLQGANCYHATSTSAVDGRLTISGISLPVRGVLTTDRYENGFALCGASSFRLATFLGTLSGPVTADTVDCHGADPNPVTPCTLSLGLTVTDGTGVFRLFHLVNGQLQVQVDFKLVSGTFPTAFGTAGSGTLNGTLTW